MNIPNIIRDSTESTVMYASFPQIDELRCIICEIDFIEVHQSSSKSNFHWQIMKCRLLIHLTSDIIASPVSGTERFIFIITYKEFFETGKLEQILTNLKLVYRGLRPITSELYKTCLYYTIQTKIAPLWNIVGQYFVHGKEFYNSIEGIRALKLDIVTEEKGIYLQLYTMKIKIPQIKLENYLPSSILSQFLAAPKGYIDLSHSELPYVHVLPSLKKGKLLSASKEIPTHSIFKDYDQLRRHWKNMYGYSLPKNKNGILYYEIKFPVPRSSAFTYPDLCVTGQVNIIPNRDKEPTVTQFLSDMLTNVPIICNKQLQISKYNPIYARPLNIGASCSTVIRSTELDTTHTKKSNPTSTQQLEFSPKYVNEVIEHANIPSTSSLKMQLTRIHQIHNTQFNENIRINTRKRGTKENRNETVEAVSFENEATKDSNSNTTVTEQKMISTYFEELDSHVSEGEPMQIEEEKVLTLKEKLIKAKSNNSGEALQEMDKNIDVEAMAKNNKLHQVKNSILSAWLKKHSIPHNAHGNKIDLIHKVRNHIRSIKVLHQFRV